MIKVKYLLLLETEYEYINVIDLYERYRLARNILYLQTKHYTAYLHLHIQDF